ncbi:serine/threonine protein kinase [Mycobacterium sp.]|uniref:serine/threonine protein kinase n=1 Tax=Mycobacterium sp. TaxID=1785 RepID=UPI003A8AC830
MSALVTVLRAVACAALVGGAGCAGIATVGADPEPPPAPAPAPDPQDILADALSRGYSMSNCGPEEPPPPGVVVALSCGQNSDGSGPAMATYLLYSDVTSLRNGFSAAIQNESLTTCGDTEQSPTTWRLGSTGAAAGKVACGTFQDAAEIIWTTEAKNVLSYIRGQNVDVRALYNWWRIKG